MYRLIINLNRLEEGRKGFYRLFIKVIFNVNIIIYCEYNNIYYNFYEL